MRIYVLSKPVTPQQGASVVHWWGRPSVHRLNVGVTTVVVTHTSPEDFGEGLWFAGRFLAVLLVHLVSERFVVVVEHSVTSVEVIEGDRGCLQPFSFGKGALAGGKTYELRSFCGH